MSQGSRYAHNYAERPRSLRETQKGVTRAKLIDSAISVIIERGMEAFTMEEIASRARLGRTTMYKYFENKDDLAAAARHAQMAEMVLVITSISQITPGNLQELAEWLRTFEKTFTIQGQWMHQTAPTAEFIEFSLVKQEAAATEVLDTWAEQGWQPAVKNPSKSLLLLFVLIGRWLSYEWVFGRPEPACEREALLEMVNAEIMRIVRRRPRVGL